MIKCVDMRDIVILIHKRRDDLESFFNEFPQTYIFVDEEIETENEFLMHIEHSSSNMKNVIGNGIRHIHRDFPDKHIVLVNDLVSPEDVKAIISELKKGNSIIIANNDNTQLIGRKRLIGIKIITKLYNLVHRQKANNLMSNVQGIPADKVQHFVKLKGDTCNILISERFIIKDNDIDYKYINVRSNVYTDAPAKLFGYLRCILIICFVFIKFMLSSLSAFIADNLLSLLGYSIWSPLLVTLFSNASFSVPGFLMDREIISTAIARIISSIYNYYINKKVVFSTKDNVSKLSTACKYFTLVLIIWVFNTIIMKLGTTYLHFPFAVAKIGADIIMYFVSFTVQRDFVFGKSNK